MGTVKKNVEHGFGMLTPPRGSPPDFESGAFEFDGEISFDPDTDVEDDSDDTTSDPLRAKGWHDYVHPTMRELTKNLRAKKKTILMNRGLEKAGMTMKDLPQSKCQDSADLPREGLCFKFILGNCNRKEGCHFCHVPAKYLTDKY